MSITAKVTPQGHNIKGRVNVQNQLQVTEYRVNTNNIRLGDILDVDTSNAADGGVLIYNGNTSTFETTTIIENENTQVNGGHY